MLRYLGIGKRSLGEVPMPPHKRMNWEFLAVIRGWCAPLLEGEPAPPLQRTRFGCSRLTASMGGRANPERHAR